MPFPFTLPTTSNVSLTQFLTSNTHPSLPLAATQKRTVQRDALKAHKRLPPTSQPANLSTVIAALNGYIPYLLALDAGLSGRPVSDEQVDLILLRDVQVKWRCTLTASALRRDAPRTKLRSLEADIFFTFQSLAFANSLLARDALRPLYRTDEASLTTEARTEAITKAMRHLLQAQALHKYLYDRVGNDSLTDVLSAAVDLSPAVLSALSSLALAEATLIAVLKDDPYPVAVSEDRNKNSKDWMFKSPDLSASRSTLLVRICMSAAKHAADAVAGFRNARGLDDDLITYVDDLRRTARAKAARFQGIAAENQGKTGEGIAWIKGAKHELGFITNDDGKVGGFAKLRKDWREKREDKKIIKGDSDWGADAGKFEEGRVLDMLEKKWTKINDTVSSSSGVKKSRYS
jgi:BRO1-like domain